MNVSDLVRSPVKMSGSLPLRRVVAGAAAAIIGAGTIGWGAGNCGAAGCTNGGGGGTLSPAATASPISC